MSIVLFDFLPFYGFFTPFLELRVAFAKVFAAEKTVVSRERRWVCRLEYEVFIGVDQGFFGACIPAPK